MTIIFLARRFYPLIGGVEKHTQEVGKILVQKGHKVIVITEEPEYSDKKNLKSHEIFDGLEIIRIKVGENDWFKKFRIWKEIWKLRSIINNAQIVHCHDVFFWYLPLRFLYPSKKVYTTFHGYETKFPPAKKAVFMRKLSAKLSNGNIAIGNYIKKWYGTQSDFVIYGGVNRNQNSKLKNQNYTPKIKIAFIGRLDKDIGINTYEKSLRLLKERRIKFEFEAYGEGVLEQKLLKYGKVSGFKKNINKVIGNADIIFASTYLIMLEALAQEKVVIAVHENELKEDYLKDSPFAKYIYICKNSEEITQIVESVKKDPWKSESMVNAGFEWAREQTWEKVTNTYLQLWSL